MGILPHRDVQAAMRLAFSLDIPFWPQLPRVRFQEDMYAQACDGLPGFAVDAQEKTVRFSYESFLQELETYAARSDEPDYLALSEGSSVVFRQFLEQDVASAWAIRGHMIGPVSFGLKIFDAEKRPVIYNPDVRSIIFDAFARKVNWQYRMLSQRNPRAFVWLDEPGLEMLWMSFTGYTDQSAKADLGAVLEAIQGPRGIHLCGKPDWDFLLTAPIDILSLDAYRCGEVFVAYDQAAEFLRQGGVIGWGIVPTHQDILKDETLDGLRSRLAHLWSRLAQKGIAEDRIARQAVLAPATCCLLNPDEGVTVERAFEWLRSLSVQVRREFGLDRT